MSKPKPVRRVHRTRASITAALGVAALTTAVLAGPTAQPDQAPAPMSGCWRRAWR